MSREASALEALKKVRSKFRVERMPDGRIGGIAHSSDALKEIVDILDEAIAKADEAPTSKEDAAAMK